MIYSAEKFAEQLFGELALNPQGRYYIALSGGLDSTVLLHLMHQTQQEYGFELVALHVNHQLQAESESWELHCKKVCADLNIPIVTSCLELDSRSEVAARDARYQWFSEQMKPGSVLMTAHHRQDRAETFLFNLMRGSGSSGLSSLRAVRPFHGSRIVRPLLALSREDVGDYARSHQLSWVEDPSNQELDYSRNKIRHNVIPALQNFRQDAVRNIARAADNLEQENGLLREVAICDLVEVREQPLHPLDKSYALCFDDFVHLSPARQTNLVRFWLQSLHLHTPSRYLMTSLLNAFIQPTNSTAVIQEDGTQFRFYRGFVYVMPALQEPKPFTAINWNIDQPVDLYQQKIRVDATVKLRELFNQQRRASVRLAAKTSVNNPKALQGHSLNLKKWLQDIGIPPWRRQSMPLLTMAKNDSDVVLGPVDQQQQNDWVLLECPLN